MAIFPAVAPTSMDFTAPEFPVRTNSSLSGVVSRRIFGNRGSRAVLNMNFDNISDDVASQFFDAWNTGRGTLDGLTVPSVVFDGASSALFSYLSDGGDGLMWHFAEPPRLERVAPGISSVRVVLEATRDF